MAAGVEEVFIFLSPLGASCVGIRGVLMLRATLVPLTFSVQGFVGLCYFGFQRKSN